MNSIQQATAAALLDDAERTEKARNAPRCVHVRTNGVRCGSPAMRGQERCYFHDRQARPPIPHHLPLLEDANGIQCALMVVIGRLYASTIDHKTAALLLYALRIASANLKDVNFQPSAYRVVLEPPNREAE
jgi:hypothetical protein